MMNRTVVVAAVRTPFGRLGGALGRIPAVQLAASAIAVAVQRSGIEGVDVEYVVLGQVLQAGVGQAPARQAAVAAGLPRTVPAETINKVCASGLRAIGIADQMIRAGDSQVVVAGGMESMSLAPHALPGARLGYRLGHAGVVDLLIHDGLTSTFDGRQMIEQASLASRVLGISRERQDRWALRSHERAVMAEDRGWLADELVTLATLARDEGPRRDTSFEALARLAPVLDEQGSTTAGNAPGISDGAAAVVVTSEAFARRRGLPVLATILAQAQTAGEMAGLARSPAEAGRAALAKAGIQIAQIGRIEINEAFASVALHSIDLLGADPERVNVNGGAIAFGHPIGASGGRILATLVHELRRSGGGLGLATICSGGGQGDALLIEV